MSARLDYPEIAWDADHTLSTMRREQARAALAEIARLRAELDAARPLIQAAARYESASARFGKGITAIERLASNSTDLEASSHMFVEQPAHIHVMCGKPVPSDGTPHDCWSADGRALSNHPGQVLDDLG